MLDEVYKLSSLTAILDSAPGLAREGANTNEIIIPKMSMDGLKNYSRNSGYTSGDVTLTYETVKFNYDRGTMFTVDWGDNEESAGLAYGRLAGEFIRTRVAPEIDAFRLATYASTANISTAAATTYTSGTNVITALVDGSSTMDEAEVPSSDRILLITPTLYNLAQSVDLTKQKGIFDTFSAIIKVPQSRFYTKITLNDGTTEGQESGGFTKATDGKDINFMIIHKPAILQYQKHIAPKVIRPDQNQNADAWKFGYRNYGLSDVYENKTSGIYLSAKAS